MGTLTADDWVAAAVARLGEAGVDAVRVEPLAQRLGVSKGSFYWHFANREALLTAVLAAWEHRATDDVITRVEAGTPDARRRVEELLVTVFGYPEHDGTELAVRAWARVDAAAREAVTRVDARRVTYVAGLLEAAGIAAGPARDRAELAYRVLIGEFALRSYGTAALSRRSLQELGRTLTT